MKTNKQLELECRQLRSSYHKYKRSCESWRFMCGVLTLGFGFLISIDSSSILPILIAVLVIYFNKQIAKVW